MCFERVERCEWCSVFTAKELQSNTFLSEQLAPVTSADAVHGPYQIPKP